MVYPGGSFTIRNSIRLISIRGVVAIGGRGCRFGEGQLTVLDVTRHLFKGVEFAQEATKVRHLLTFSIHPGWCLGPDRARDQLVVH